MVVVACLFRPMLLLSAAVPQRNYVGVLIDDSRSMQIADRDGKPRSDWVEHAFGGPDSTILKALRQKFIVRLFRFSSAAQRIDSVADVHFSSNETHNPPSGIIATANGRITPDGYPNSVSVEWEAPWRTERIYHVLRPSSETGCMSWFSWTLVWTRSWD